MRTRLVCTALTMVLGLVPAAASAGALVSATWTQNFFGAIPSVTNYALTVTNGGATCADTNPYHIPSTTSVVCPSAGLQATGAADGASYNVSLTMPLFELRAFTTGLPINIATAARLSGAQAIAGDAFSAVATQAIAGEITIGGAQHTMASLWFLPPGSTIVVVPLSIGGDGRVSWDFTLLSSYHYATVDFYGWTPGSLSFMSLTVGSMALPDVVAMGSFALTPGGAGTVTLVAPSKLSIDGAEPLVRRRTVTVTALKLTFVPEPAALLLLGASALVLLGSARRS